MKITTSIVLAMFTSFYISFETLVMHVGQSELYGIRFSGAIFSQTKTSIGSISTKQAASSS